MSVTNIEPIIDNLKSIAYEAGEKIMRFYSSSEIAISIKEDKSPVSAADIEAHKYITSSLAKLANYPIVSEEDTDSKKSRKNHSWFWLIDPLDGTKEFLDKNGEFTVNIALVGNGQSSFGIVYAPAIDLMYWGGINMGSYRSRNGLVEPIKVRSDNESICRVVASKSHLNTETQEFIAKLGNVSLVQSGSSLKFCRIAEGSADIYPRLAPTCEWDTAAAQAILEAAGGFVLDLNNKSLRYGKSNVINPSFIATRNANLIPK